MAQKIKMLETHSGSKDGINTVVFEIGSEYEIGTQISERLVSVFVDEGWAEMVKEKTAPQVRTKKVSQKPVSKKVEPPRKRAVKLAVPSRKRAVKKAVKGRKTKKRGK